MLSQSFVFGRSHGFWCAFLLSGMVLHAGQPDLIVNAERLAGSVTVESRAFAAGECPVVEACASTGTRKLLLFDTGFINVGDADGVVGNPATRPDLFQHSPCHGHFHMGGLAAYEVLSTSGETVLRARKQGFCLRDNVKFDPAAGAAKYNCDYQGLTAGWEDVYDKTLDCQWLDITGLAGGDYVLKVSVNPESVFAEGDYSNNAATVPFTLPGDGNGNGNTNEICKIKTRGKGFIVVPGSEKPFHFDFKFHSWNGETKGHFWAFDEESSVCITGVRVIKIEQVDDQTVSVELEAKF